MEVHNRHLEQLPFGAVRPFDRHITTFITPWVRIWYKVAPQGSLSLRDGFTYWFDSLIRHLVRKKKCIDYVAGWADTLAQLFEDTKEFQTVTTRYVIVQNVKKFIWGWRELEYVGFWIMEDRVRPSDETLKAIMEFLRPLDITGICSWYGLVEQVSFAFREVNVDGAVPGLDKEGDGVCLDPGAPESF